MAVDWENQTVITTNEEIVCLKLPADKEIIFGLAVIQ